MTILAVSRWSEVFETAESRRHNSLHWISVPVTFNSTGLQRMLDEFDGVKAAALYGCWNALLKIAATAPVRGVLAGQKGEAYSAGRLARLSGFPQSVFEELIPWCVQVGWLVTAQPSPGLPDRTLPDLTKPNRTGPKARAAARSGPEVLDSETQERGAALPEWVDAVNDPTMPKPKDRDVVTCRKCKAVFRERAKCPSCGNSMVATTAELEAESSESATMPSDRRVKPVNGPASVNLLDLLVGSEFLRALDAIPVTASGVKIYGPVVSSDRIKREEIERASTEFWWTWYRDQLGSSSVILRAGNMVEAVYTLAAVLAAKRLRGIDNKLALWIKWIKVRECHSITANDWRQAAERIARFTNNAELLALTSQSGERKVESRDAAESPNPATAAAPVERSKRPPMTRAERAARAAELREKDAAT